MIEHWILLKITVLTRSNIKKKGMLCHQYGNTLLIVFILYYNI